MSKKNKISILVVDDELSARKLFASFLQKKYLVSLAESTTQALSMIDKDPPDIVIADIKMPGKDGLVLLSKIKEKYPNIVVIVVTGNGGKATVFSVIKEGAFDYLEKPIVRSEFLYIVGRAEKYCKLHKQLKILEDKNIQTAKLSSIASIASGMAHKLNNPLATIMGYAKMISMGKYRDVQSRDKADKIYHASLHMKTVVDHFRTFAKTSKDGQSMQFMIAEPINSALEVLKSKLESEDVTVDLSLSYRSHLLGDKEEIETVFQNLLTNSCEAFKEIQDNRKKLVVIKSTVVENKMLINYKDNAVGMTNEVQNHLFDPFYTTNDAGQQTCLGMSIAYNIINKHNGSITVESEIGMGSKFVITFPIKKEEILMVKDFNEEPEVTVLPDSEKSKILIIDDNPEVAQVASDYLNRVFHTIIITDSTEALKRIEKEEFDLILTDYKMPNVSGMDVLYGVRDRRPDTPVIVMSGYSAHEGHLKEVLSSGAKGIITKPFEDPEKMISFIKTHIKQSAQDSSCRA